MFNEKSDMKLAKLFKIFVVIIIILAITFVIVLGIYFYEKIEYAKFEEYTLKIKEVISKVAEVNDDELSYVGIKIKGTELEVIYNEVIAEINKKYEINIADDGYYLLKEEHLKLLGLDEYNEEYFVEYSKNVVFSVKPYIYKEQKHYTIQEIEHTLTKEFTYNYPIIPEGFQYVEGAWNTGYVIEDKKENQFVWIPVGYLNEEDASKAFLRYLYDENSIANINAPNLKGTEEYKAIVDSIKKYEGFYIGRYETSENKYEQNGNNKNLLQIVKNNYPLVYVQLKEYLEEAKDIKELAEILEIQDEQVKQQEIEKYWNRNVVLVLAKRMAYDYGWVENGIHTTVMYDEHYDTILKVIGDLHVFDDYINDGKHPITEDNSLWGNFTDTEFIYSDNTSTDSIKKDKVSQVLKTGVDAYRTINGKTIPANKVFNIYDLAGNVAEWTPQMKNEVEAIIRGGSYINKGKNALVAKYKAETASYSSSDLGFRVVMYLD